MTSDFDTLIRARVHAQRMIKRDRDGFIEIIGEVRATLAADEGFPVCRFPNHAACQHLPGCPYCMEVGFTDPRTDAEIANIIIAGN